MVTLYHIGLVQAAATFLLIWRLRHSQQYALTVWLSVDGIRQVLQGDPSTFEFAWRWERWEPLGLFCMVCAVVEASWGRRWLAARAAFMVLMIPTLCNLLKIQMEISWIFKGLSHVLWAHQLLYSMAALWLLAICFAEKLQEREIGFLPYFCAWCGAEGVVMFFMNCRLVATEDGNLFLWAITISALITWPVPVVERVRERA